MINRKNARLAALACFIIFAATTAVLLARQLNLGPARPAPDFRTFGPKTAALEIYEYTDFACPACRNAALTLEEMLNVYGDRLRLSFKHYPLKTIHPWSMSAAAHADCAGEQGKFKEYASLLFENQSKWARTKEPPAEFKNFSDQLGLDWAQLTACTAAPATLQRITLDIAEADVKGVAATPTFFINGKRAVGGGQLLDQVRKFDSRLRK